MTFQENMYTSPEITSLDYNSFELWFASPQPWGWGLGGPVDGNTLGMLVRVK